MRKNNEFDISLPSYVTARDGRGVSGICGVKTNIQKKQQLEVRRTIFRQYIVELEFLHIARSKISLYIFCKKKIDFR